MPAAPSWRTAAPRDAPSSPRSLPRPSTVLARANRLVTADDYRNTVRRGRRSRTGNTVVYLVQRGSAGGPRFGFIVSKAVGNAVTRNLIRRRLKSACRSLVRLDADVDVVVRALPSARHIAWTELENEVTTAVRKGMGR
ncbi:ribonuclease P protein component [Homoserinimonas sp. A520]